MRRYLARRRDTVQRASVALSQLQIQQVRNLRNIRVDGLQSANVFYGSNGSGKTSVLEAIHLLGMARSFRNTSIKSLITHGAQHCTVFGTTVSGVAIANSHPGHGLSLGVQRNRVGDAQIKIGGRHVRSVAELAVQFPLQVLTAESFGLLTGPPAARRQYLDWGVFHVEQGFYGQWQRFQRSLKQRNNLLRRGKIPIEELAVWTRDLAQAGTAINELRSAYFQILSTKFKDIMSSLAPSLPMLELRFVQGWDRQLSYSEALEQGRPADMEQGFTHCGPQRADIRVLSAGVSAAETLSRGQQKLVVCGLKLAQGQLMSQVGRGHCTYLIDDLPSELDRGHGQQVCHALAAMDAQVFITCIDQNEVRAAWPDANPLTVFHVEHGSVRPVAT